MSNNSSPLSSKTSFSSLSRSVDFASESDDLRLEVSRSSGKTHKRAKKRGKEEVKKSALNSRHAADGGRRQSLAEFCADKLPELNKKFERLQDPDDPLDGKTFEEASFTDLAVMNLESLAQLKKQLKSSIKQKEKKARGVGFSSSSSSESVSNDSQAKHHHHSHRKKKVHTPKK